MTGNAHHREQRTPVHAQPEELSGVLMLVGLVLLLGLIAVLFA